ncbi:hypothetical protein QAD02_022601 [Eretmocerus hayati]|uniref:Uncharacterized protein n=1 Tax=Eretmocerus hayati TaxID=131215 RepID=A0ACC2PTS3_9HYME|nr:hypothetical protein QAD02_022601 [Eretmocerus hayati]
MEVDLSNPLMANDPRLIDHIVGEVKSQGIFDQFRKECLADVDTKPAYQNLRTRVEGSVNLFLNKQTWRTDLNKNQLRDTLRKHIHDAPYLEVGVERIVDQVVNPKIYSVFMPQIEDVVYKYLGIERPKPQRNGACDLKDLLPKDLDPISPESDRNSYREDSPGFAEENTSNTFDNTEEKPMNNHTTDGVGNAKAEIAPEKEEDVTETEGNLESAAVSPEKSILNTSFRTDEASKTDDDEESPVFEPIDVMNLNESNMSNDSHLSGISELTSHRSQSPDFSNAFARENIDCSNQDSQLSRVSSNSRLSIVTDFSSSNHAFTPKPETKEESKYTKENLRVAHGSNSKEDDSFESDSMRSKSSSKTSDSSKENSRDATDYTRSDATDDKWQSSKDAQEVVGDRTGERSNEFQSHDPSTEYPRCKNRDENKSESQDSKGGPKSEESRRESPSKDREISKKSHKSSSSSRHSDSRNNKSKRSESRDRKTKHESRRHSNGRSNDSRSSSGTKHDSKSESRSNDKSSKDRKRRDEKKSKAADDHSSLRKNVSDRRSTDRDGSNGSSKYSLKNSYGTNVKRPSNSLAIDSGGDHHSSGETSDSVHDALEMFMDSEQTKSHSDRSMKRMSSSSSELSLPLKKRPLQANESSEKDRTKKLRVEDKKSPRKKNGKDCFKSDTDVTCVPDDERVQIIEIPYEDFEEPYGDSEPILSIEETTKIILDTESVHTPQSKLSEMEQSIRQSLNELMSDHRLPEQVPTNPVPIPCEETLLEILSDDPVETPELSQVHEESQSLPKEDEGHCSDEAIGTEDVDSRIEDREKLNSENASVDGELVPTQHGLITSGEQTMEESKFGDSNNSNVNQDNQSNDEIHSLIQDDLSPEKSDICQNSAEELDVTKDSVENEESKDEETSNDKEDERAEDMTYFKVPKLEQVTDHAEENVKSDDSEKKLNNFEYNLRPEGVLRQSIPEEITIDDDEEEDDFNSDEDDQKSVETNEDIVQEQIKNRLIDELGKLDEDGSDIEKLSEETELQDEKVDELASDTIVIPQISDILLIQKKLTLDTNEDRTTDEGSEIIEEAHIPKVELLRNAEDSGIAKNKSNDNVGLQDESDTHFDQKNDDSIIIGDDGKEEEVKELTIKYTEDANITDGADLSPASDMVKSDCNVTTPQKVDVDENSQACIEEKDMRDEFEPFEEDTQFSTELEKEENGLEQKEEVEILQVGGQSLAQNEVVCPETNLPAQNRRETKVRDRVETEKSKVEVMNRNEEQTEKESAASENVEIRQTLDEKCEISKGEISNLRETSPEIIPTTEEGGEDRSTPGMRTRALSPTEENCYYLESDNYKRYIAFKNFLYHLETDYEVSRRNASKNLDSLTEQTCSVGRILKPTPSKRKSPLSPILEIKSSKDVESKDQTPVEALVENELPSTSKKRKVGRAKKSISTSANTITEKSQMVGKAQKQQQQQLADQSQQSIEKPEESSQSLISVELQPPPQQLRLSKQQAQQQASEQKASQQKLPPPAQSASVPNGENFVMPPSPDSDVSASSDKNLGNAARDEKRSHRSSQRYSSDDLYKPRPLFASSSRRTRRSHQA